MNNSLSCLCLLSSIAVALSACASTSTNRLRANEGPVQEAVARYLSSKDFKAYAIQVDLEGRRNNDVYGFAFNMVSQAAANQRAIEFCLQQALADGERCVVYAEGDAVVFQLNPQ